MHDFNAAIMLVTLLESYLMLECMKYALKYRIKDMEIFLWFFFQLFITTLMLLLMLMMMHANA